MFVVIGMLGALLLVASLVFDDVIDGLVPDLPYVSGAVIGAFLAAFGVIGWFVDDGIDASGVLAGFVGVVGGIAMAAAMFRLTQALVHLPTDATPTTDSLVGKPGRIVTPVRADGVGEVLVLLGGASTKYTATADADLPTGAAVVVTAVESPTKVRVQSEAEFWS
jgi:membrane protein implicated in regulation of membrane protease activity